jgi:hypothetical protein
MSQDPESTRAQVRLRQTILNRAKYGYHPDGSTASGGLGGASYPLPNTNKRNKYVSGKTRAIPNSKGINNATGKYA